MTVLNEIRNGLLGGSENNLVQINLNETSVERLLSVHSNNGYIIISSWRGENTEQENNINTKAIKDDIKASKFGHFPVWGGFVEKDEETGEKRVVKEKSFVITNFKKSSNDMYDDSEDLRQFGVELCNKYNQESFLYKPKSKDKTAMWIDKNNNVVQEFATTSTEKVLDTYFTMVGKFNPKYIHDKDTLSMKDKDTVANKSFTYIENIIYMQNSPNNLAEARMRYGEEFFRFSPRNHEK